MVVCVSGGCAARLRSSVVPTPSRINRGTHGDASRPSRGRARSLRAAASAVVTTDSKPLRHPHGYTRYETRCSARAAR